MLKRILRASFRRNHLSFFVKFAVVTLIFTALIEYLQREGATLKFNSTKLTNPELKLGPSKQEFLQQGKASLNGWGVEQDQFVRLNFEEGRMKPFGKRLSWLNFRAWDFFVFYTQEAVISVPFVNFGGVCSTSLNIFNRANNDLTGTRERAEMMILQCPEMDLHSVSLSKDEFKGSQFEILVEKDPQGQAQVRIEAPSLQFSANFTMMDDMAEGQFWALPLSNSEQLYFVDNKKFGIPVRGSYSWHGKTYQCDESSECLSLYDLGRGQFTYFTNWYWASFTTYAESVSSDEEVILSLNMGDGLGIHYQSNEKAAEDFVGVNGKHFKLDQTTLEYDPGNLTSTHRFQTNPKHYPQRQCTVTFQPLGIAYDGLYAVVLGFQQYFVFGEYSGKCNVDGEEYVFEKVLGTVEHVRAKF